MLIVKFLKTRHKNSQSKQSQSNFFFITYVIFYDRMVRVMNIVIVIITVLQKSEIKNPETIVFRRLKGRRLKKTPVYIDFHSTGLFHTFVDRFEILEISPHRIFRYLLSQFFHLKNVKIHKYVRWFDVTGFAVGFAIAWF